MKTSVILLASVLCALDLFAQGTAFTYQGRLNANGGPANGTYDLVFTIFASANGLNDSFANQTNLATSISNGLFTVSLNLGLPGIFTGEDRWLEIEVRTNGVGPYAKLSPRQKITATPYAVTAGNFASGALAGTFTNAVTFSNGANSFVGLFTGNGTGLTNVSAATLGGLNSSNFWKTSGNAGTTAGAHFIGTTDNQALAVKVNSVIALQFMPGTTLPNLVGGLGSFRPSVLATGVSGAVIVGGNAPSGDVHGGGAGDFHAVYDNDGTVGGGFGNKVGSNNGDITDGAFATVAGGVFNSAANYAATVAGGDGNFAGGQRSFIGGGYGNQAQAGFSAAGGGLLNSISANADYAVIGGGQQNGIRTNSPSAIIAGGYLNGIGANSAYSAIGGGYSNNVAPNSSAAIIGGGIYNDIGAFSSYSAIGGGYENNVADNSGYATIAGGYGNDIGANSYYNTIGGGYDNDVTLASSATIGGGYRNAVEGNVASTIAGGYANYIGTGSSSGAIGGGEGNRVAPNSDAATIAGGYQNDIGAGSGFTTIGGGQANHIADNVFSATIAGGLFNRIGTNSDYGAIGGGLDNNIGTNSSNATIAGGSGNNIGANSGYGAIGGGYGNTASGYTATVGGGIHNTANGAGAFVGGGGFDGFNESGNVASGGASTISGGFGNLATDFYATVSGGYSNTASGFGAFVGGGGTEGVFLSGNLASGPAATISGGLGNRAINYYATIGGGGYNAASGTGSFVGGGSANTANGTYSTVPGGYANSATNYSFAAGFRAKANHTGSFVWADSQNADFSSTANNQFNIRAQGGVQLNTDTSVFFGNQTRQMLNLYSTNYGIGVQSSAAYFRTDQEFMWYRRGSHSDTFGDAGAGGTQLMRLGSTGSLIIAGTLSEGSDRNIKQDFAEVDPWEVLEKVAALDVRSWSYTNDPACRHLGPVAQDFHAAFGLNGADDKHIATVDADGVALAAIQGLNDKVELRGQKSEDRIQKLETENAELKQRLEKLERLIENAAKR